MFKCAPGVGWSHFAQFTIAVVNKDPKKSKYSGMLFASPHIAMFDAADTVSSLFGLRVCLSAVVQLQHVASVYLNRVVTKALSMLAKLVPCKSGTNFCTAHACMCQ